VCIMDGSWTVFGEKMGFFRRALKVVHTAKVLKTFKKEILGDRQKRPVTPEVASSSLVGPARKIQGLREQRNPCILLVPDWCQITRSAAANTAPHPSGSDVE